MSRHTTMKDRKLIKAAAAKRAADDSYIAGRQAKITKTTRVMFLATTGGRRSPDSGSRTSDDPVSDEAPEGETQLERKRRLNRNNERKKRAKRVMKIEDLTSTFHTLTSENEALKAEQTDLKERIEMVKQYMQEHGKMPPAAGIGEGQLHLQANAPATATLPATASRQAQLEADRTAMLAILNAQAGGMMPVNLSFIPLEQRIMLLSQEYLKQQSIINQMREWLAAGGSSSPSPPPVPAGASLSQSPVSRNPAINPQDELQKLLRQLPAPTSAQLSTLAPIRQTVTTSSSIWEQLQQQIPPQIQASSFATPSALANNQPHTGNEATLQQQLMLALEAIQNLPGRNVK